MTARDLNHTGAGSDARDIAVIAAVAANGVIGADLTLPWRLPGDLARFRRLTTGHAIVMGRRTWQSLGRALPGRQSIVVSRDPTFEADGGIVVPSLDAALAAVAMPPPAFVIGGAALFAEALPRASTFHLTEVHAEPVGDVVFPAWDRAGWCETAREEVPASGDAPAHAFVTLARTL
jgi:dihydrofolate reductase